MSLSDSSEQNGSVRGHAELSVVIGALRENTQAVSSLSSRVDSVIRQQEALEKRVHSLEKTAGSEWLQPTIERMDKSLHSLVMGQQETFKILGSKADRTELFSHRSLAQRAEQHEDSMEHGEEQHDEQKKLKWVSIGISIGSLLVGIAAAVASAILNGGA